MNLHGWSLRKTSGDVYPLPDSATLQRWIVEGRVTRDDEVAQPGQRWVKAGELGELEPFFAVVEQARRARAAAHQGTPLPTRPRDPRADTGELVLGATDSTAAEGWQAPTSAAGADEPAWVSGPVSAPVDARPPKRAATPAVTKAGPGRRRRRWPMLVLMFALLVVLGLAAGAALFIFEPSLVPAEFGKFVRDRNPWGGGAEGSSQDGGPRAAAPAVPVAPAAPTPQAPVAPPPASPAPAASVPPAPAPASPAPPPAAEAAASAPREGESSGASPAAPAPAAAGPAESSAAPGGAGPSAAAAPNQEGAAPPSSSSSPPPAPEAGTRPAAPDQATPAPAPQGGSSSGTSASAARAIIAAPSTVVEKKAPAASSVNAQLAKARQLRDSGRSGAALDVYARALQANPRSADAHAGRGLAYLDLSQYRQAEESFKAALEIDPSHPSALMGLAETYRYQGKRTEAVELYRRYVAAHPKGEDAAAVRKAIQALEESP